MAMEATASGVKVDDSIEITPERLHAETVARHLAVPDRVVMDSLDQAERELGLKIAKGDLLDPLFLRKMGVEGYGLDEAVEQASRLFRSLRPGEFDEDAVTAGLDLPENIFPCKGNSNYVSLTNIGGDGIQLDKDRQYVQIYQTSNSRAITGVGSWEKVSADDFEIEEGKRLGDLGLGVFSPIFHIEQGNITIQSPDGLRIAVPEATAGFDDISKITP